MSLRVLLGLIAFLSCTSAQVQLQFSPGLINGTYSYSRVVAMPNRDTLLIGSIRVSLAIGLYNPPPQHAQITLSAFGPVQFRNVAILPVLGGRGNDVPQAATVDSSGNIWIVGNTDSEDFNLVNPIVSQKVPYRTVGFVVELDPSGTKLLFATYLAGQQPSNSTCTFCFYASYATAVVADKAGNIYVGGSTNETGFPTTPGAFMNGSIVGASNFGDTFFSSYILKISPAGKLVYGTLLGSGNSFCVGGSGCIGHESTSATVNSIAIDGTGMATVSGVKGGSYNLGTGYVLRLAADGSKLLWSTAVGANYGGITALLMAEESNTDVDLFGRYVTPIPQFGKLPAEPGPPGLFVAKLSSDGSNMIYSTDLGTSADANAAGIVLDASDHPYIAGTSSSSQFPSLSGVPNLGADFGLQLDASGTKPQSLFRFPRGTIDAPPTFDGNGNLQLLGAAGGVLTLPPGYAFDTPAIVGYGNAASYVLSSGLIPGEVVSLFGFDLDGSPQSVQVSFDGVPAMVLYAGPNQINVQVPFEFSQYLAYGPQIQVVLPSGSFTVKAVAATGSPGIFTTDGVHAAALNQDGSANSASNPLSPAPS